MNAEGRALELQRARHLVLEIEGVRRDVRGRRGTRHAPALTGRWIEEASVNVATILQYKGDYVHTIAPEASLRDAAQALDAKRIGALVVVDELRRVRGVLSERDITREIARHGAAALDSPVSGAMSQDVVTAAPSDTVEELMDLMTDRRVRHLPVMSGGRLCGIVSIGDVVKWRLQVAVSEVEAMRAYITMR